jgi:glycosyltransferase involved in cell wall biosynthesis
LSSDKIKLVMIWARHSGNVTSVNDLVPYLDKSRFDVKYIYLSSAGANTEVIKKAGSDVFFLRDKEPVTGFSFLILHRLIQTLKQCKPDIIHCHGHKATVYGSLAARFVKIPVVISHVHGLARSKYIRRKVSQWYLYKKVDRILCVANSVREDVLKSHLLLPAEKVSVLENSIDFERFAHVSISKYQAKQMLGLPADAFVFGTAGRLVPTKGLSYLVDAFSKLTQVQPKAHLVLLGTGQCKEELQQQATDLSCGDRIHFPGFKPNIEQLIRGFDVFVLSSIAEGMPRVILEAMASGVPCIATNVGGNAEIINNQDVGFVVKPKDPEVLYEAMINVIQKPKEKLERIVAKAGERVRSSFSHEVVANKLKDFYEQEIRRYCENNKRQIGV